MKKLLFIIGFIWIALLGKAQSWDHYYGYIPQDSIIGRDSVQILVIDAEKDSTYTLLISQLDSIWVSKNDSLTMIGRNGVIYTYSSTGDTLYAEVDSSAYSTLDALNDSITALEARTASVSGGYDLLEFTVGTTTDAPAVGDSLFTHGELFGKSLEVFRGGDGAYMPMVPSRATSPGYELNDSTLTVHPVYVAGDIMRIHIRESANVTSLVLRDIDQEGPTYSSAEIGTGNDTIIYVTLSDVTGVDTDSVPNIADFTFETSNDVAIGLNATSFIDATTLGVALDSTLTVFNDSTLQLTYVPSGYPRLQDTNGFESSGWTDQSVTNNLDYTPPDETAPIAQSFEIGTYNDSIVMGLFDEALNADSIPATTDFLFETGGQVEIGLNAITLSSDTLFAALDSSLASTYQDSSFTITYTQPTSGRLQDASGNLVASWADSTVTNNLGDEPAVLNDGNTQGWYIAEAEYVTQSDDSVSQWDDVSGNDYHLTNNTDIKPLFQGDSIIFGHAAGVQMGSSIALDTSNTWYAVMCVDSYFNSSDLISNGSTNMIVEHNNTDNNQLRIVAGSNYIRSNSDLIYENTMLVVCRFVSYSSSGIVINNGSEVTEIAGEIDATNTLDIGDFSNNSAVSFKEIIIRNVDDSSEDRTAIMDYLNNKYTIY